MAQCILSVKHCTVFIIKHDAMSTTCQAEHPVYYLSIFHLFKHGTIFSTCQAWLHFFISTWQMFVTCSRMTPCLPPVQMGTIWSAFCQAWRHVYINLLSWALWSSICQAGYSFFHMPSMVPWLSPTYRMSTASPAYVPHVKHDTMSTSTQAWHFYLLSNKAEC
jgi:hypothetical protein